MIKNSCLEQFVPEAYFKKVYKIKSFELKNKT